MYFFPVSNFGHVNSCKCIQNDISEIYPFKRQPHKMVNLKLEWKNGKLPTNCLSVFDHFVGLTLKGI